ncbi:MAG: omptin family outer membrane protease [Spirochaetes bacterium]|nr:omptin family outer membrane protease [Spirochaetota bacterium]
MMLERWASSRALPAMAALAILAAPGLGAQVSLEASTSAGVLFGTSREIVLQGTYIVSQLDWAMQPLVFSGSELRASTPAGLRASLEVRSGVPGNTGRITDKDFLNYDGEVTHYSEHDSFTEGALLLDARLGWQFVLGDRFAVEPFTGFSLMRFKWTARDGFLQYPPESSYPYTPWDPLETKVRVYGTGIVYQQTWYIPVAGVQATLRFGDRMDAALTLGFSPYLWMNDLDNHELRQLDFVGTVSGGFLLDPSLGVSWRISLRARLSLDLSYRIIWGLVGDTLMIGTGVEGSSGPELDPGEWIRYVGSSGTFYDALGLSLSLDLSL